MIQSPPAAFIYRGGRLRRPDRHRRGSVFTIWLVALVCASRVNYLDLSSGFFFSFFLPSENQSSRRTCFCHWTQARFMWYQCSHFIFYNLLHQRELMYARRRNDVCHGSATTGVLTLCIRSHAGSVKLMQPRQINVDLNLPCQRKSVCRENSPHISVPWMDSDRFGLCVRTRVHVCRCKLCICLSSLIASCFVSFMR